MKRSLAVLLVLVSAAACVALADPGKDKGRLITPSPRKDEGRPTAAAPGGTPSLSQPGKPPTADEIARAAAEAREKEREHRKKMPALEGTALDPGPRKGNAQDRKPFTAAEIRKHAERGEFDAGRKVVREIEGRPVTLTPAGLKSVDDLRAGPRVLGRFRTEQPTEQLPAGEYDLLLSADGGAWRVLAARSDGTELFEARDVRVRVLEGAGKPPANEIRHGSLIFIMYYVIDYPVVSPYGPWWSPYNLVWVPQVVQVVFYFP